jgi:hypothetical protein
MRLVIAAILNELLRYTALREDGDALGRHPQPAGIRSGETSDPKLGRSSKLWSRGPRHYCGVDENRGKVVLVEG